jgi:hypothetical protein
MYIAGAMPIFGVVGFGGRKPRAGAKRTYAMTVEILYLTAQLQRWLNERIARHLAAQAAKLDH